jgi:hypothetical protein
MNNKNIPLTTTDMEVNCFANNEKLVASDERILFNKDDYYDNDNEDYALDVEAEQYVKPNVFQTNNTTKINNDEKKQSDKKIFSEKNNTYSSETDTKENMQKNTDDDDPNDESKWTHEELMLRKLDMLKKLGELKERGVKISTNYTLNHDYKTMKMEYELHTSIRSKRQALNFMGNCLVCLIKGVELVNDNVNPWDLKFDGKWSEKVATEMSDYYEILGEIYEKYTTPGKAIAPELRLLVSLLGGAGSIIITKGIANMTHSADDLEKNPDKFREIQKNVNQQNHQKMNDHWQKEHNIANERMNNIETMKQHKKEFDMMNDDNVKKQNEKHFNSMILSDARSANSKKKSQNQYSNREDNQNKQNIINIDPNMVTNMIRQQQYMQQKKTSMYNEMANLANVQKMLDDIEQEENDIMSNADTISSKKSIVKKQPEQSQKYKKYNNDSDDDVTSIASSAISFKNPNRDKILGRKSDESSVKQHEILDRNTAEKMIDEMNKEQKKKNTKKQPAKSR